MTDTIIKQGVHEGKVLRLYIKRSDYTQEDFAEKLLGMTRQNLGYHMRKSKLDDDFKRLLKEKGIVLFSDNTKNMEKLSNEASDSDVPYNIPLKMKRMAKVILPKESNANDIDTVINHLKLMKNSLK